MTSFHWMLSIGLFLNFLTVTKCMNMEHERAIRKIECDEPAQVLPDPESTTWRIDGRTYHLHPDERYP